MNVLQLFILWSMGVFLIMVYGFWEINNTRRRNLHMRWKLLGSWVFVLLIYLYILAGIYA